jgi:hypothetical protein
MKYLGGEPIIVLGLQVVNIFIENDSIGVAFNLRPHPETGGEKAGFLLHNYPSPFYRGKG